MKNWFLALTCLLPVSAFAGSEKSEFDAQGLDEVVIENISGNITINASDDKKATVTVTKRKFSEKCHLSVERVASKISVKVSKETIWPSLDSCDVDLDFKVPKIVSVDLAAGSSDVKISGLQGNLNFKLGSGDVVADGVFKSVKGKSGSGDIEIKGLTGGGDFRTGSGDIDLKFASKPKPGELDIRTGSGDAVLHFPKGSIVKTKFAAGSGELTNELGDTPQSPFVVSMKAGSGDLKVKTY